jgi:hypothetical protein
MPEAKIGDRYYQFNEIKEIMDPNSLWINHYIQDFLEVYPTIKL